MGRNKPSQSQETSIKEDTKALERYLEKLFEKRGATREKALSSMLDIFTSNVQHRFVENKYITLQHRCLNCIKQGSSKEVYLASHVIGLLFLTIGCTSNSTQEMFEETVSNLSQALQSASEPLKVTSLLDCLTIITFVGRDNFGETERSMQAIWQFIDPKSSSHVTASEPHSLVLTAAICAWSYLLATMDRWNINSKLWKEAMSIFSNLLHNDDLSLRMAAGEALALIFEIGSLEKFYNESMISNGTSSHEESEGYTSVQELKEKIVNQVKGIVMETGGINSADKALIKSHRTLFLKVLRVFKGGYSPDTEIRIGEDFLKLSAWSQLVQVNYLKRFLGAGFVRHVQKNELLHDFLEFTPSRNGRRLGGNLYIPSDEKVGIRYVYQPEIRKTDVRLEKMLKSPNSVLNKAKTQLMNNKRMLSQARNDGYYAVGLADED